MLEKDKDSLLLQLKEKNSLLEKKSKQVESFTAKNREVMTELVRNIMSR